MKTQILFIDDENERRDNAENFLLPMFENMGYQLRITRGAFIDSLRKDLTSEQLAMLRGKDTMEIWNNNRDSIGLIIADIQMESFGGPVGGLDFCRKIALTTLTPPPVIIISKALSLHKAKVDELETQWGASVHRLRFDDDDNPARWRELFDLAIRLLSGETQSKDTGRSSVVLSVLQLEGEDILRELSDSIAIRVFRDGKETAFKMFDGVIALESLGLQLSLRCAFGKAPGFIFSHEDIYSHAESYKFHDDKLRVALSDFRTKNLTDPFVLKTPKETREKLRNALANLVRLASNENNLGMNDFVKRGNTGDFFFDCGIEIQSVEFDDWENLPRHNRRRRAVR